MLTAYQTSTEIETRYKRLNNRAMDKDKLRQLIINTWKDGNSQFHDQKGSIDYDADLEVWFDTIEDDINELCGGECSNEDSGLHLQRVMAMLPNPMEQNQAALDYAEQRNNPDFFLVKQVYKDGINYITNLLTKKIRSN